MNRRYYLEGVGTIIVDGFSESFFSPSSECPLGYIELCCMKIMPTFSDCFRIESHIFSDVLK